MPSQTDTLALDTFLRCVTPGSSQVPLLDAALRDARETMRHGKALWLATLGYLIVLEMLGKAVAAPNSRFPKRTRHSAFLAGAQEFAVRPISKRDAHALYGLRCALAHEYSLRSINGSTRYLFALTGSGPLVVHPAQPWQPVSVQGGSGKTLWPNPTQDNQTWVNVIEVGTFVEDTVANVRAEHQLGRVELASDMDAMQLMNFGQFMVF